MLPHDGPLWFSALDRDESYHTRGLIPAITRHFPFSSLPRLGGSLQYEQSSYYLPEHLSWQKKMQ